MVVTDTEEVPKSKMWYLVEINGDGKEHILSESFLIGRTLQADIVLTSIYVSKRHCRIMVTKNGNDQEVFILDLNSSNGVYINKKKIEANTLHRIHPGDIIGMGIPENTPENSDHYKVYKVVQGTSQESSTSLAADLQILPIIPSRKRLAPSPDCDIPAKVANIKEEHCSIIYDLDNYSQANVTIIDEDDDIFVDKIEPKLETITIEDSDDELLEYSSQFAEPEKVENDCFILSSDDDDDNPWLQRLSQGSRRSPPLLDVKIELDEMKLEEEEPFSEIKIEPEQILKPEKIEPQDEPDISPLDTSTNLIFQPEIRLVDVCKNLAEKSKYVKPPIIEAPSFAKPTTDKLSTKSSSSRSKKSSSSRSKKPSSSRSRSSKSKDKDKKRIEPRKKNEHDESRKEKLKQIAVEQAKNKPVEKTEKKASTPKVKVASTSRSDLFLQDVIKDHNESKTSSKSKSSRYKIPKKSNATKSDETRSPRKHTSSTESDKLANSSKTRISPRKETSRLSDSKKSKTPPKTKPNNVTENTISNNKVTNCSTSLEKTIPTSLEKAKSTSDNKVTENNYSTSLEKTIATSLENEKSTSNNKVTDNNYSTSLEKSIPTSLEKAIPTSSKPRRSILRDIKNVVVAPSSKKVGFNLEPSIREFEIEDGRSLTRSVSDNAFDLESLMDRRQRHAMNIRTVKNLVKNDCLPIEEIIWEFTNWSPDWLVSARNTSPFELVSKLGQKKNKFETFLDYYSVFVPLILCEMFSYVKKQSELSSSVRRVFQVHITTINHGNHCQLRAGRRLSTIEVLMILTKQEDMQGNHPKTGEIVIIQVPRFNQNEVVLTKAFGYITNFNKQSTNSFHQKLPTHLSSIAAPGQVAFKCSIVTNFDPTFVTIDKPVNLRVVARISTFMRQFTALQNLPTSILMPLVLNPLQNTTKLVQYQHKPLISKHTLNTAQLDAIFESCALSLNSEPKICVIHGPPGTGKSYVIVNLVLELLYGDQRYQRYQKQRQCLPKILLCAPSNAAVDSLAIRLLSARKNITDSAQRFRMVRVGQPNSMDPSAKAISLQSLCENYKNRLIFEKEKEIETEMNTLQNRMGSNFIENSARDYSDLLLEKADVVCTTLGSCFNSQLERLSKLSNFRFTCCIMDESTQCCEPDSLLPLSFNIDTLVLVGDPRQLPATVLSQEAKKYGYDESLFGRFEKCFQNIPNQIRFLNTQYRMHPEIARFPNEYFYQGQLQNGPNVLSYNFPLTPYLVFNHDFLQCSNESNANEVTFTVNLVKAIISMFKSPVAIGIIAPYNQQCSMIEQGINDIDREWRRSIKTNTIDGFQGLERDIIIFSCVRTDGIGFLNDNNRLNVALTRARQAMYIIVNFHSLQKNSTWNALKQDAEKRQLVYSSSRKKLNVEDLRKILKNKNYS